MAKIVTTNHPASEELIQALGLPKRLVSVDISFRPNKAIEITTVHLMDDVQLERFTEVVKKFSLVGVEHEDDQAQ